MTGHPRVLLIKSPPEPEKPRWLAPNGPIGPLLSLMASVVILGLIFTSANSIWRYVKSTGATLKIEGDTLRADDFTRAARAEIATTVIVQDARNAWAADPGGKVFAFRTSDLAYYSGLPFLSNLDTGVVPFLEIEDPQKLWEALRANDFRLVLQPGYPSPEVNNTAFDALLADPRYMELVSARDGMRLLRIRGEISQQPFILLGHEGAGSGDALNPSEWTAWSSPASDIAPAIATGSPIRVEMPQRLFADRERWDYIDRGIPEGTTPPAFVTHGGVIAVDMDVEGRGRADLFVVNLKADGSTGMTQIWSGTLLGERRSIAGQMAVPQDAVVDANGKRQMGLRLRTYRGGPMIIHGWRVRWMPSPASQTDAERQHYVPQGPAERVAALESSVLRGTARAALVVRDAPPQTEYFVLCPQGEVKLALVTRRDGGAETDKLPCWPLALVLATAEDAAPRAVVARLRVIKENAREETMPLVRLQDALKQMADAR